MVPHVRLCHEDFTSETYAPGDLGGDCWSEGIEVNGVEQAAEILLNHGLVEGAGPNEGRGFDGFYGPDDVLLDVASDERRRTSGHLHGFSASHTRRIADLVHTAWKSDR